jgi:hypothetical protein
VQDALRRLEFQDDVVSAEAIKQRLIYASEAALAGPADCALALFVSESSTHVHHRTGSSSIRHSPPATS